MFGSPIICINIKSQKAAHAYCALQQNTHNTQLKSYYKPGFHPTETKVQDDLLCVMSLPIVNGVRAY